MLPNCPVYVLFDIGVVLRAVLFFNAVKDVLNKYNDISALQFPNALADISVADGKLAVISEEQLRKQLLGTSRAFGKSATVSEEQALNAQADILYTFGKLIVLKL